ncbi:MAG: ABC transporter ATP-binding protein [Bacilli bacterium]
MKKTLSYLKKTKKEVILGPLFKMLEVCFELCVPLIVSQIVDKGIKDNNLTYILLMCVVLLIFACLGLASTIVAQYYSAKAACKLATNLRNDLFKKIQSLQYSDLDELGLSTLVTRMTSDVSQVQTGVNMTLRLLLRSPAVIIGAVIVSFTISKEVGLVFLCTVPTLFLVVFLIMYFSIPFFNKSQEKLDRVVELTRENLVGVRVIRAFNKQKQEIKTYQKENNTLFKSQLFVGRLSTLINPLTYALINIFIIALIYVSGLNVQAGNLSQGDSIALYNLSSQILVETIKFASLIITVSRSIASSNRIDKILSIESKYDIHNHAGGNNNYIIEFDHVSMTYKTSDKNSLKDINFKVKKGQTVGIIGGTGSGKTTLINVMNHFYDINQGTIYFEGKDIASYPLEYLHDQISLVPQKAKLFAGTIKENLLWGNKDATDEDLIRAIKASQSEDIIKKKKDGINEKVEQNGNNFSGGQKQRLCIARALVKKAKILILDDSSSALDYATDAKLRHALLNFDKSLTTFIISQRTSSLMHCDQILVLDNGELVGVGTHEELLKNCEVYQEIHNSQFSSEVK